ncbi:MAG: 16S rRNA (cytosine(1402)-N(4))-methyltransferase RsmH [Blastocatellia bacterium]|nr:16S rRNA (cytosine(1402)-N(4))-methyltransferase RsmH [Blastocatellia bacterium]
MCTEIAKKESAHEPVLLEEIIGWLRPERGGVFLDCTLGPGGHTKAILEASPLTRVIGIDRDLEAIRLAGERLATFEEKSLPFENRFQAVQAGFEDLTAILSDLNVGEVQGIVADLGVSSLQLQSSERGFSFLSDAPLDMRMDRSRGFTAADLLNRLTERELADLIFEYGEERGSRKIARAIIREREREAITTTRRLADIVARALRVRGRWRIHPATRTFQAIRIAVNDELNALRCLIPAAVSALVRGGRLAIISFHSLEDRIVKRGFQIESGRCLCSAELKESKHISALSFGRGASGRDGRTSIEIDSNDEVVCSDCGACKRVAILTRKPIRPSPREVERNPRSRSALLRVCERI